MKSPDLAAIMALARAGAIDEAVRRFEAADAPRDDPAASIVEGRLLKELALRAPPGERKRFYRDAAAAYERSATLEPATYPLINAATLTALGGRAAEACELARKVLRSIEEHPDEPETPYYRAATSAEALLLLDREGEARGALAEAISLAPRAWEDHAITLRQFTLILDAQGRNAAWLDEYRPPRSIHFSGHMSFNSEADAPKHLQAELQALLNSEKIGFGYGALAAGADIIVAEALVAHGAELHAVLPGGPAAFAAASVDPLGQSWRRRFDVLVERAETVRTIRPAQCAPRPHTIRLADEIAMGAAVMNARRLETEAVQLLVIDGERVRASAPSTTLDAQRIWSTSNRRQHLLHAPREAVDIVSAVGLEELQQASTLAVVALRPASAGLDLPLEAWLRLLREGIGDVAAAVPPYWSGGQVLLALEDLEAAAKLVQALARDGHRAGGDYCAASVFEDPFSQEKRLPPGATEAAEAAVRSAPGGSACVTEDFVDALAARGLAGARAVYVGELDAQHPNSPLGLFALR